MADADAEMNQTVEAFLKQTRCGASVWTTFRLISNLLYSLCWTWALPVELILNRRMGRRYTGLLPVVVAFTLAAGVLVASFAMSFQRAKGGTPSSLALTGGYTAIGLGMGVLLLALLRHRIGAWWRFRSGDQVHSFSNGIPFWLHLPKPLVGVVAKHTKAASAPEPIDRSHKAVSPQGGTGEIMQAISLVLRHLGKQFAPFVQEWRSGAIPTGPFMWIASTVVHPLLIAAVALFVIPVSPVLAVYLAIAGGAIFLKARLQKAVAVEAVYDIVDSRIEHEFMEALSNPAQLRQAEQRGVIVPGIARTLAEVTASDASGKLAPEHTVLLNKLAREKDALPFMEPKPMTQSVITGIGLVDPFKQE